MGILSYIACHDCKVVRCLDKFYIGGQDVDNRKKALEYADEIKKQSFRAGLAISFMLKHQNHNIVFFTENDYENDELCTNENSEYVTEDEQFWNE